MLVRKVLCFVFEWASRFGSDGSLLLRSLLSLTSPTIDFPSTVDRITGEQFEDSKLEDLAISVLNAASSPLNVISNKGGALGGGPQPAKKEPVPLDPAKQISIIPSS